MALPPQVLPAVQPLAGEGRGAFVRRVQGAIAEEMGCGVSEMTIQQKRRVMQEAASVRGKRRGGSCAP